MRDASTYEWDAAAWYGGDFNKLWIETEGEHVDGSTHDARVEAAVGSHRDRVVEHAARDCARISAMARRGAGWRSASRDSRRVSSSSKPWPTWATAGARRCAYLPTTTC